MEGEFYDPRGKGISVVNLTNRFIGQVDLMSTRGEGIRHQTGATGSVLRYPKKKMEEGGKDRRIQLVQKKIRKGRGDGDQFYNVK